MLKTAFENLRSRSPLIHNITNYVTVNDCANMVLACGASPIMADDAAVKQVLQQRAADVAKSFENYLQDQYEIAQKAQVCTKGNDVALIIDGNAAALAQLFDSLAA